MNCVSIFKICNTRHHALRVLFNFLFFYFLKINCINNAHLYKLLLANSAMTAAHKVSTAREPISVVEKRQQ